MSLQVIRTLVPSVVRLGALKSACSAAADGVTTVYLKPQMTHVAEPIPSEDYMKKIAAEAAKAAAKAATDKILEPAFMEKVKEEAKRIGHICEDWEFNTDDDSPSVWCPGCRHVDEWQHTVRFEEVRRNPPPPRPVYNGPSFKELEEARWCQWVGGLTPLGRQILAGRDFMARIFVKEQFYGQHISWCEMLDKTEPGWDVRVSPERCETSPSSASLRPRGAASADPGEPKALTVVKAKEKKPAGMWAAFDESSDESEGDEELLPHVASAHHCESSAASSWREAKAVPAEEEDEEGGWETTTKTRFPDPFEGFGVSQWLKRKAERAFGKDKHSPDARAAELASWLAEKPRRVFTADGYIPAKRYEAAKRSGSAQAGSMREATQRSSLLVTGYGSGVGAADVRLLAAICGPVRDIFSPRSGNLMFVEYMDPEAAGRAKALFAEHAVVLGGRRLIFDISKPKGN